jgi:hydrogenase maturation protease
MDIRVLGLGNVLMGDDAFGPSVIEAFTAAYDVPANVSVIDLGTPGLELAPFLMGADAVIVVDTVRADGPPGTVYEYARDRLLARAPGLRLGPHDPGLTHTLLALQFAGCGPAEVRLVGAVPSATAPCARLSAPLRQAIPVAVAAVVRELERLGAAVVARPAAAPATPWWERAA